MYVFFSVSKNLLGSGFFGRCMDDPLTITAIQARYSSQRPMETSNVMVRFEEGRIIQTENLGRKIRKFGSSRGCAKRDTFHTWNLVVFCSTMMGIPSSNSTAQELQEERDYCTGKGVFTVVKQWHRQATNLGLL